VCLSHTQTHHARTQWQGTLSQRFEALIKDFLRPFAMRKQIDKGFLEFQQPEIRQVFLDPYIAEKSRKVCHSI